MADSLDDGEFWLPPQFLTDDDIFMDKKITTTNKCSLKNAKDVFSSETDYSKPFFPLDFPYGVGSFGVSSDLSSPVESVVGSTEESDEEDYIAGLTCQMARSTLEDDFRGNDVTFGNEKTKAWVVSGSPQSTLCGLGSGCGCRQASCRGRPNDFSRGSSTPATWDLLYAAAGEVARMRINQEGYGLNGHNSGILGPPRKPSPVSVPVENSKPDAGLYPMPSLTYQKLQAAQFQQLRQQQLMKQQSSGLWGGQPKGAGFFQKQQTQSVVHNGARNPGRPLGLPPSAWPPLQHHQGGSGMRAVFLGNPGGKRECAGTGVFLPRRASTTAETRKKSACSTVLLPARVVQALNLNLDDMGAQPQLQPRFNGTFTSDSDVALRLNNSNHLVSHQKRSLRPQPEMNGDVRLPHEWTY
ncbi:hypothetical protein P3X46_004938 [Hevea brasiliensis]|uniref:TIP41-like protein n=1 Tax=Hevea brasiliensis TaxID=3981 RepID=A0ABQ9N0U8_HEVBR|nr:uncharacterized protein LOC110647020 [Hevea brasiliensis]KAJ9185285.1 hypothetical protein P3X46_004938 [Hevea brasiliensis]